ncbi:hypothetical protein LIA77_11570 [Sarocladium implicatum]|nr:hypothetical protein LIA77_11570 [Sarocladium implicatum]
MFPGLALALALVAYFPATVLGCIQIHTYMQTEGITGPSLMYIQVWLNGKPVCSGGDSQWLPSDKTVFSLQNGDGKGSGCAPGYSVLVTDNGNEATFHYWGELTHATCLCHFNCLAFVLAQLTTLD